MELCPRPSPLCLPHTCPSARTIASCPELAQHRAPRQILTQTSRPLAPKPPHGCYPTPGPSPPEHPPRCSSLPHTPELRHGQARLRHSRSLPAPARPPPGPRTDTRLPPLRSAPAALTATQLPPAAAAHPLPADRACGATGRRGKRRDGHRGTTAKRSQPMTAQRWAAPANGQTARGGPERSRPPVGQPRPRPILPARMGSAPRMGPWCGGSASRSPLPQQSPGQGQGQGQRSAAQRSVRAGRRWQGRVRLRSVVGGSAAKPEDRDEDSLFDLGPIDPKKEPVTLVVTIQVTKNGCCRNSSDGVSELVYGP
ncbi:proline-rich protein 2-like [Lathamus discolor]|uniref:proline-rich protein 2-like n=1 Tax=Lathamus discolor TaxID=678569 RepID=UPI0032B7BE10